MVDERDRKRLGLGYAIADYVLWRDAHGGGMAAAMVLAAGRSALKRLKGDVRPDEVEELWRRVMKAVRVEERLDRAKAKWRLRGNVSGRRIDVS